jgi:hypothetical protein
MLAVACGHPLDRSNSVLCYCDQPLPARMRSRKRHPYICWLCACALASNFTTFQSSSSRSHKSRTRAAPTPLNLSARSAAPTAVCCRRWKSRRRSAGGDGGHAPERGSTLNAALPSGQPVLQAHPLSVATGIRPPPTQCALPSPALPQVLCAGVALALPLRSLRWKTALLSCQRTVELLPAVWAARANFGQRR